MIWQSKWWVSLPCLWNNSCVTSHGTLTTVCFSYPIKLFAGTTLCPDAYVHHVKIRWNGASCRRFGTWPQFTSRTSWHWSVRNIVVVVTIITAQGQFFARFKPCGFPCLVPAFESSCWNLDDEWLVDLLIISTVLAVVNECNIHRINKMESGRRTLKFHLWARYYIWEYLFGRNQIIL